MGKTKKDNGFVQSAREVELPKKTKYQEQQAQVSFKVVIDYYGKPAVEVTKMLETVARLLYAEFGTTAHVSYRGATHYYKDSSEKTVDIDLRSHPNGSLAVD